MESTIVEHAANILPPREGKILVVAVTDSSVRTNLGSLLPTVQSGTGAAGTFVTLCADGADVYVVFGDDGVVASDTATSGDTRSWLLKDGVPQSFAFVWQDAQYVAHKCASGNSANLRMYRSSGS